MSPRLLTTSASAIRKIQRLGEIHDLDVDRQVKSRLFFYLPLFKVQIFWEGYTFFFVKAANFISLSKNVFIPLPTCGPSRNLGAEIFCLLNCQSVLFYTLSYIVYSSLTSSYGYTFGVYFWQMYTFGINFWGLFWGLHFWYILINFWYKSVYFFRVVFSLYLDEAF